MIGTRVDETTHRPDETPFLRALQLGRDTPKDTHWSRAWTRRSRRTCKKPHFFSFPREIKKDHPSKNASPGETRGPRREGSGTNHLKSTPRIAIARERPPIKKTLEPHQEPTPFAPLSTSTSEPKTPARPTSKGG